MENSDCHLSCQLAKHILNRTGMTAPWGTIRSPAAARLSELRQKLNSIKINYNKNRETVRE